jgi:hypothetical protein
LIDGWTGRKTINQNQEVTVLLAYNEFKQIMKKMMICFQYKPQTQEEAKELFETYYQSLSKLKVTKDQFANVAGRLVLSWKPEFGRKFPAVSEITDLIGVSAQSIAETAHSVLKSKIMTIGGYDVLDLGKEHRHFVAMEAVRKMGGWFAVCQNGVEQWERNKKRFCTEFENIYYSGNVPKKPLLCGSDLRNQEYLAKYNSNQIEG